MDILLTPVLEEISKVENKSTSSNDPSAKLVMGIFMKIWFNPRFHKESYSLRKHISTINKLVTKIKPPRELQRLPRSLDQISFFKASEFRAWLLFYCVPILSVFLPAEYTNHLILFVSSVHILLSDNLQVTDLDLVDRMLSAFYETSGNLYSPTIYTGNLYSPTIYTANMHSLVHTVPLVRLWEPLWSYSMFGFENLNGYLGGTFHGTRKIIYQMCFHIQLTQSLAYKLRQLSENESPQAKEYIEKITEAEGGHPFLFSNFHFTFKMSISIFLFPFYLVPISISI